MGYIAGTYRVHDNIFLQQFNLSSQEPATPVAAMPPSPATLLATALSDTQFQAHVEDEDAQDTSLTTSNQE